MSSVLWHFLFWHGFSLLLGLYELTLLGSVPPEGCGGCSDRAPSSKAFGWRLEIFLTLAAISPWDGAWQNVVPETASRVRADYRWGFFSAWLIAFLFQRVFVEQLRCAQPCARCLGYNGEQNQLWSFPSARHSSNNHTNGCNMATVE